jgi:hypothetical protein
MFIDPNVLQIIESTDLVPLDGDVAKITRRAEEFKDLHESLQRNLPTCLALAMDALFGVHQKMKATMVGDANRQAVSCSSSPVCPESDSSVSEDARYTPEKVEVIDGLRGVA